MCTVSRFVLVVIVALAAAVPAAADIPPRGGGQFPAGYRARQRANPRTFTFQSAFRPQVERMLANRREFFAGRVTREAADKAPGGTAISGKRSVPVFALKFSNTPSDPYAVGGLETRLFGTGPGTMTSFYLENSYNLLTVTGSVTGWFSLPNPDTFYEGRDTVDENGKPAPCNGVCDFAKTAEMIRAVLAQADKTVDFGLFDNDGPDGIPNSGDDNGVVDFVALVHPEAGGECSQDASAKQHLVASLEPDELEGQAVRNRRDPGVGEQEDQDSRGRLRHHAGVRLRCEEHDSDWRLRARVRPRVSLPDLYDTNRDNGDSEGVGNWCLMAGGSWGGDGRSPDQPSHMSAWAKVFLGWVQPVPVQGDLQNAIVKATVDSRTAVFKVPIVGNRYYLVEYRPKKGSTPSCRARGCSSG